jgi:hypothetical protein
VPEFVENELNSRDLVIEDNFKTTNRTNKFASNNKENFRETKQNFMKVSTKNNRYDDTTPDLFNLKNPQQKPQNIYVNKNPQLEPMIKKQTITTNINQNLIVINRKEAKKYEDLLRGAHSGINYELATGINTNNMPQPHSVNPRQVKPGKVMLDPINNNNFNQSKKNFFQTNTTNTGGNKKIEVSFKATMQFSDGNNKFEISPNINLNNQNILNVNKKVRLDKIPESRFNNELEFDDQE